MKDSVVTMPTMPLYDRGAPQFRSLQSQIGCTTRYCSNCYLRQLCLPCYRVSEEMQQLDKLVQVRRRLRHHQSLYRAGDRFKSLYAIHHGSFKTYALTDDGREQVTGFHLSSDIMGMDGIENAIYTLHAVALEDSEVCVIPFDNLEKLAGQFPILQHQFFKIMAAAILRYQALLLLLKGMRAEERMAFFLLTLSQRFAALGYPANEFQLCMKREEIGSYLGLSIETVSRIFSRFHQEKLIDVHQKHLKIINPTGLHQIVDHS